MLINLSPKRIQWIAEVKVCLIWQLLLEVSMHPEDDQHLPTILSHMLRMDCSNPKVKELIDVVIQARPSVAPQHTSPIIFILDGVSVIFLFPATCSMLVFCCFFTLIGRWVLCYYVVSPFLRPFL